MFIDHYNVLGVNTTSNTDTIKKSYRKLALKFHPDVCKLPDAQKRFIEIQEAYEILSDVIKRHYYDILWKSHFQPKEKTRDQEMFEEKIKRDYQQWKYQANESGVNLANEKFDKVREAVFDGVGQAIGGAVNFMSVVYGTIFLIGPFIGVFVNWTDYKNGNEASLTGVVVCSILSALIIFFTILYIIRTSRE